MILKDKNETLQAPVGYEPTVVEAQGAYLRLEYVKRVYESSTKTLLGEHVIDIYLNDMGREVMRTARFEDALELSIPTPVSRKSRILNGLYLILAGLQEMLRCVAK